MMESAACVSVRCREHPMLRSTFSRAILAKKAYLGVLFVKGILRLQHTNLPIRFLLELSLLYHIISNVGWLVNAFSPTLSTQTHGDCRSFEEISEADETMQSKNPLPFESGFFDCAEAHPFKKVRLSTCEHMEKPCSQAP